MPYHLHTPESNPKRLDENDLLIGSPVPPSPIDTTTGSVISKLPLPRQPPSPPAEDAVLSDLKFQILEVFRWKGLFNQRNLSPNESN